MWREYCSMWRVYYSMLRVLKHQVLLVDDQEGLVVELLRPNTEVDLLLLTRDRRTSKMKTFV